jgi:hypothetical protein
MAAPGVCLRFPAVQSNGACGASQQGTFPGGMEKVLGFKAKPAPETAPAGAVIQMPFTSEEQVQEAIRRRLLGIHPQVIVQDAIERAKGRV